jgi:glycosyltransferase involved in cell wall biosynthesis
LPMRATNFAEDRLGFPYPLWSPSSLRRLASAVAAADVVHLHDCLYVGNVAAFVMARARRKPIVVTQHTGDVPFENSVLRALSRAANASLGGCVLGRAEQVVFISQRVKTLFEGRLQFASPPLLIMNGVDSARFHPARTDLERARLRQELELTADRPVFLFVGRFIERKGLAILRRLAESLPGAHWLLAGWGSVDPGAWKLPQVRVFQRCSAEQLRRLYVAADLLVLPSVGEGFPLVVQEAMACGTPALVAPETAAGCPAANAVILQEPLGGGTDAELWSRQIRALIASPARLTALRSEVETFAVEHWSWRRAASAHAECFRRVAPWAA